MDFLPLFFNLQHRWCLLVGGGEVALRKAELLRSAGANIKLVAPAVSTELKAMLGHAPHVILEREFETNDLNDVVLAVSATDNREVNAKVSREAQSKQIPVNVVDQPQLCTVIFPAIVDRSPVIAAVSTGGNSPVLTRLLREMLEGLMGEGYGRLATFLGERREYLKARFTNIEERRRHTESFMASAGRELAMSGQFDAATEFLERSGDRLLRGEVYLVGAGPGDPDLLTLKALQLMQRADVVLYDSLVSDAVLGRLRRDARKEYVGKRGGGESTEQESINDMLVRLAHEGHRVLRLKGGDPFIFGRGGEEIEALAEQGIPFTVVPGITAANGCAAYAGIPLTHRDYSQSVRFVTGHPKDGEVDLEWREFAHPNQTIVFYMGLGGLASICRNMMAHGRDRDTPVAIISKGTTPDQKIVVGTLATIHGIVTASEIARPTLTIVGEVVRLYQPDRAKPRPG